MLDRAADGKAFSDEYKKKFNRPLEVYAASFYDGLYLIAGAMKAANSIEPREYSKALAKVNYKGIAGVYRFDQNHDLKDSPVIVFQFKGPEPVALITASRSRAIRCEKQARHTKKPTQRTTPEWPQPLPGASCA